MSYNPPRLSEIDTVEIVNLHGIFVDNVSEYMKNSGNAEFIRLSGEAARQPADLWRKLPEGGGGRCHNPPFGLRFYAGENLILQASICWQCDNIFGDEKGVDFYYNFDSKGEISQELLSVCKSHFLYSEKIIETERTNLREIIETDAAFVLDILNQPSFIRYIGDRNVRSLEQAREYIESRFTKSYKTYGFGMWAVELKETKQLIGLCGFVRRDSLPDADIGFAFLPAFEGKGYAFESADSVMKYGRDNLNFERVLAITSPDNEKSGRLLGKIGFTFNRLIEMPPDAETLKLFSSDV